MGFFDDRVHQEPLAVGREQSLPAAHFDKRPLPILSESEWRVRSIRQLSEKRNMHVTAFEATRGKSCRNSIFMERFGCRPGQGLGFQGRKTFRGEIDQESLAIG